MEETQILAHIVVNEAGTCGFLGMLAIAWVYSRNKTMYGIYGTQPVTQQALHVATLWWRLPDPTMGAYFAFSDEDLKQPRVQALVGNKDPTLVVRCRGGASIHFYRDDYMSPPLPKKKPPRVEGWRIRDVFYY